MNHVANWGRNSYPVPSRIFKGRRKVRPMKEYKGFYVDDDLNIYSERGTKLKPFVGTDGYYQVTQRWNGNGKLYHVRVHRMFATLFIPNPNHYKYVNHIDSNKLNNSLDNLEWCTNAENVKHGWHSGNRTHKNRTKVNVYLDGTLIAICDSIREVGEKFHVDRHKVARILKGEIVNHYKYTFEYAKGQTTIEKVLSA